MIHTGIVREIPHLLHLPAHLAHRGLYLRAGSRTPFVRLRLRLLG